MNLSDIVVLGDVMSLPGSYHDWVMHLFAVWKFGKMNLNMKNVKGRDIRIPCENTRPISSNVFTCKQEKTLQIVKALNYYNRNSNPFFFNFIFIVSCHRFTHLWRALCLLTKKNLAVWVDCSSATIPARYRTPKKTPSTLIYCFNTSPSGFSTFTGTLVCWAWLCLTREQLVWVGLCCMRQRQLLFESRW